MSAAGCLQNGVGGICIMSCSPASCLNTNCATEHGSLQSVCVCGGGYSQSQCSIPASHTCIFMPTWGGVSVVGPISEAPHYIVWTGWMAVGTLLIFLISLLDSPGGTPPTTRQHCNTEIGAEGSSGGHKHQPPPSQAGLQHSLIISLTHDPQAYVADYHKHSI